MIAADIAQVEAQADLQSSPILAEIERSWPGPSSWVLPARAHLSRFVTGAHKSVAMRICDHPLAREICREFGAAIVSTSANRSGEAALLDAQAVQASFGQELDYVLHAKVGGATCASTIRDGQSGQILR